MQFFIAKKNKLFFNASAIAGVFVLVLILLGSITLPAHALTVNPRVELDVDPGTTVHTTMTVVNDEQRSRTFYLNFENFNSEDEQGTPSFSTKKEDLASWMKGPASITLGPQETAEIPFEIDIPKTADPGGHYAAIFYLTQPPSTDQNAGHVGIVSQVGTLLLLRVNGDFVQNATILEFGTSDHKEFYTGLPIQFYYRFQNTGDDHQKPLGDIQIKNMFGQTVKIIPANTIDGSVLPKSIRRFVSVWTEPRGDLQQKAVSDLPQQQKLTFWQTAKYQWHNFAFGRYTANLKVVYGTKELKSVHAEYVFYVIPWQLLSIVVPSLIIFLVLLWFGMKKYNRYIVGRAQKLR